MNEKLNIDDAPKDGRIIYIGNDVHNVEMLALWNKKSGQWEGKTFSLAGKAKIRWDKKSSIQPNYWRAAF